MSEQRGRFAPSPTGDLHLGNARTALLAWLWSRSEQGAFLMRVEDLDTPRVRPGLAERQLDELRWLGLDWDGEVVWQSQRFAAYEAALARLGDHVYECFCSRAEVAAASAPHAGEEARYPGTCRALTRAQRDERRRTRAPSLRLRVPEGELAFRDEILGEQRFDTQAAVGDFVLRRSDGIYAYQLAVVVDDGAMGVTQVLRGRDLLPSVARQVLLHRLLGSTPPRWAHAPLVTGADGARLSKRDKAVSLSTMRAAGADPRQVVARLARSSGIDPGGDACAPADLVAKFELTKIPQFDVVIA